MSVEHRIRTYADIEDFRKLFDTFARSTIPPEHPLATPMVGDELCLEITAKDNYGKDYTASITLTRTVLRKDRHP